SGRGCGWLEDAGRFTFTSTVASGAATIKIISRTSMTSINGVTLISCISPLSSRFSLRRIAIQSTYAQFGRRMYRFNGAGVQVQIAALQQQNLRGNVTQCGFVTANHAREDVIDNNRRDSGNQTDSRGQQRFCDTRRDDRKVSGLRLGDTDKAVHDAPDGTEQADERGDGADSRQVAVTAAHMTTHGRNATLQTEAGTLFNAFVIFTACGEFQLVLRFVH